jgi:hypothetical protein
MLKTHLGGKTTKKRQNSDTQPAYSFPTPKDTEKPAGLLLCQAPAPDLLGRCRPSGEQKSSTQYPTTTPGIKQHSPLDRQIPALQKQKQKTLNNKLSTEKKPHSKTGEVP